MIFRLRHPKITRGRALPSRRHAALPHHVALPTQITRNRASHTRTEQRRGPASAWRTNTAAATTTRPPTSGGGCERRALGGVLPRGDLLPRAARARATRL